jgi:glycosyltransferase involved in cell wall biosynthesis
MKIGFYGGMANNMYVFAKAFHALGKDVLFIRDVSDHYPLSQPLWEDLFLTFSYDQLSSTNFTFSFWQDYYREEGGWKPDSWVMDPLKRDDLSNASIFSSSKLDDFLLKRYYLNPVRQKVLNLFESCSLLVVCGIEGEILAYASGKPYVIWPHGGDMRLAAGIAKFSATTYKQKFYNKIILRLLKASFRNALAVGTHDPRGVGGHLGDARKVLRNKQLSHLPIPLDIKPKDISEQNRLRNKLKEKFNLFLPTDHLLFFVPSRIDYFWKKQDLLLEALEPDQKIHLIFSGWGKDYEDLKFKVEQKKLTQQVSFLPCVLSKPYLYQFYYASDLVIDQFKLGSYGTAAVEAMSQGTPVMMYIHNQWFKEVGWEAPPVINVSTGQMIQEVFKAVSLREINLEAKGKECQEWVEKVHGPQKVLKKLTNLILK